MGYSLSRLIPPPIKGVEGSLVGLGSTVVIEDDYEYEILRARVSASFWRENVTAVVILLGVLAETKRSNLIKCSKFRHIFSITITVPTFLVKKNYNEAFRGVYFLGIRE